MNINKITHYILLTLLLTCMICPIYANNFQDNPKYQAAMSLLKDKKIKETKQYLSEVMTDTNSNPEFNILYMKVCLIDNDFDMAAEIGNEASKNFENNTVIRKLYGEALIGLEKFEDAEAVLKEAYDEEAIDLEVLQLLTKANFLSKDYQDTISYADKVLTFSKNDFFANIFKGYSCLAIKNYEDALNSFDTALKVHPKNKIAQKGKLQTEIAMKKKRLNKVNSPGISPNCIDPIEKGERNY